MLHERECSHGPCVHFQWGPFLYEGAVAARLVVAMAVAYHVRRMVREHSSRVSGGYIAMQQCGRMAANYVPVASVQDAHLYITDICVQAWRSGLSLRGRVRPGLTMNSHAV